MRLDSIAAQDYTTGMNYKRDGTPGRKRGTPERTAEADRRPTNAAESMAWDALRESGWEVTRRGWPDFFCWKAGKIVLIEVKPKHGRRLKFRQRQVLEALSAFGVPCYVWTPDGGFERFTNGPLPPPEPEK